MAKFKIGDRVKAVKEYDRNKNIVGKIGTVIALNGYDTDHVGVEFDDTIGFGGHTCGGKGKDNHCWWCDDYILEPAPVNRKIIITTDGKTTTAKMYAGKSIIKTATAKCSHNDNFVFVTGAKIAVDRLLGVDYVSEDNDDGFKVGDIVNIVDSGSSYTTYTEWIIKNVKDVEKIAHFVFNELPEENSDKYKIIAIAKHDGLTIYNRDCTLAYVERIGNDNSCYLMGVEGLKKC